MNKWTWIYASSRLWSSGARHQTLLFSDKKNLLLVARLCKLLLSLNLAIKINTTYGNFTTLCFLVLFWRLQSKVAQIQTVKIFRQSNIPLSLRSFLVASFYTSCSVHDGRRSLEVRDWYEFFTVHRTGVTRNLQAVRYIFSFYSCDEKFIKVNVKPTFYCSFPQVMSVNTCMIYRCLSSASTVIRSWFTYELQKSTTIAHAFGFPVINTPPPCPQNSIIMNPLFPLEILKAVHGIGMDIFWNRPFWASFAGFNPYFLMQDMNWCLAMSLKLITLKATSSITLTKAKK